MSLDDAVGQTMRESRSSASGVGVAEVTHADVRERSSDYLDGALPVQSHEFISAHLNECRPCDAFVETMRATRNLTARLPRVPAPAPVKRRLLGLPDA